ncbi:HutD family protein [Streptomyces sp. NPDC058646]|uniref:HutD/Ves family protein n=1 Tax=Streptomyces sp. NPDC058646 TaxID=3346574 RepID=UPI003669BF8C
MAEDGALCVLRAADRRTEAWKNGGGVTREIAACPEGAGTDDFAWRVSLADVAAGGPFSAFPGVDRTLTLVEGAGMDLTVGGVHRRVAERYAPQDFAGDEPTDCLLVDGPVRNVNVMYRRGVVRARTAVVRGGLDLTAAPGETLLLVALAGTAVFEPSEPSDACASSESSAGAAVRLDPYDAVLATGALTGLVRTSGHVAVVRFA